MSGASARPLVPLLILAILAGCAGGPPAVVPGPERATMILEESEIRAIGRLLRMEDERQYDAPAFEELIQGSVEVRRRTVVAAGRIGDPAAVPLLVRVLGDDPSPAVRADAAFALGELGDTSRVVMASLREAVPGAWVPVRGTEATVVVEVIHALGKLGTFEARALVLDALRSAQEFRSVEGRRVAAEALLNAWRFPDGPGRVNAVGRYVDSPVGELRWRAAYALMRLGEPDGVPLLLDLIVDEDHRARANAARGLAAPLADSAGLRDTTLVVLRAALADDHPHVRINAVRALAGYGADAPIDAMAALLEDPEVHVAIAAAGALAGHAGLATPALLATVRDARRPHALRAAAATAVAEVAPDSVVPALRAWADGEFAARYAAARTLAALGLPQAGPLIRTLAADGDPRVAVAAAVAAGGLAADTTAPAPARAELRELLMGMARGHEQRVAAAALRALDGAVPEDTVAGLRAETGLGVGEPGPAPLERTAGFYEDVARRYVAPAVAGEALPRAVIRTSSGEIVVELLAGEAPLTVHNFETLAADGYWDDGVWHRVIPNFVLQDGAPAGDPEGGPGWSIRDEINRVRYTRGVLGMALSGPDTGGSQWFITHSPQHHLDGGYTIFGRVVQGMDAADAVLQGDPIPSIRVAR